jgi:hypothetical protein
MVVAPPFAHLHHPARRWQSVFAAIMPLSGKTLQFHEKRDIPATVRRQVLNSGVYAASFPQHSARIGVFGRSGAPRSRSRRRHCDSARSVTAAELPAIAPFNAWCGCRIVAGFSAAVESPARRHGISEVRDRSGFRGSTGPADRAPAWRPAMPRRKDPAAADRTTGDDRGRPRDGG